MVCCVFGCKNSRENSRCEFYNFAGRRYKEGQKNKWIVAVQKHRPEGSKWIWKHYHRICSEHFVGNKKSDCHFSPSYIPTIFPGANRNPNLEKNAVSRFNRFLKRRLTTKGIDEPNKKKVITKSDLHLEQRVQDDFSIENSEFDVNIQNKTVDQQCQVAILDLNSINQSNSFTCVRYIYSDKSYCEVETQTDLVCPNVIKITNSRTKVKNKSVGTPTKSHCNQEVTCNLDIESKQFCGYDSIKKEKQLKQTAGVTRKNFDVLLQRIQSVASENRCTISLKNRLFIFLIIVKTGLTFSAVSVFFGVDETTISKIFFSILNYLAVATENFIFWPSKSAVQKSMPECFKPDYVNTRVIIDCTEFKIEIPSDVNNKVLTYSHYKKGFTAKVLIGITPSGFICFKSRVAGGRKTDSNITIEAKLVDLLEDGDEVLADKGFPEIKAKIDESGKKVLLVMPPFLVKKNEFSEEETTLTYSVARVRIHVERIMQRLRTYKILQHILQHLFSSIDDLLQVCCALVNMQPPIIRDKNEIIDD